MCGRALCLLVLLGICAGCTPPQPPDTHAADVRTITSGKVLHLLAIRTGGPPLHPTSLGAPGGGLQSSGASDVSVIPGLCSRDHLRRARPEASQRSLPVAPLLDAVEHNIELVEEVLAGINAKRAAVKFGASKALRILSERVPEALYPHFDSFAAMLSHDNQILKWNATLTLANLARVDSEGKIEAILDHYLDLIAGPNMITAANAIRGAVIIGQAKPHLVRRIVLRILRVEHAEYATPECRNVVIGHALRALEPLADLLPDRRVLRLFAARQLGNPRPATSAKARKFLKPRKKSV